MQFLFFGGGKLLFRCFAAVCCGNNTTNISIHTFTKRHKQFMRLRNIYQVILFSLTFPEGNHNIYKLRVF